MATFNTEADNNPWDNEDKFIKIGSAWMHKYTGNIYKKSGSEYKLTVVAARAGLAPPIIKENKTHEGISYFISKNGGRTVKEELNNIYQNFDTDSEREQAIIELFRKVKNLKEKIEKTDSVGNIHGDFKLDNIVINNEGKIAAIDWDPQGMDWGDMNDRFTHEMSSVSGGKSRKKTREELKRLWKKVLEEGEIKTSGGSTKYNVFNSKISGGYRRRRTTKRKLRKRRKKSRKKRKRRKTRRK